LRYILLNAVVPDVIAVLEKLYFYWQNILCTL